MLYTLYPYPFNQSVAVAVTFTAIFTWSEACPCWSALHMTSMAVSVKLCFVHAGVPETASTVEAFAAIRKAKDNF